MTNLSSRLVQVNRFNVFYDTPSGIKTYLMCNCDVVTATRQLIKFKQRYLNSDGTGKPYPNGKGFYNLSNPRVRLAI